MRRLAGGSIIVLATAVAVASCRSDSTKTSLVPVDTAAAMPLLGAATPESLPSRAVPPDSASLAAAPPTILHPADSVAGDAIYHGRGRCFTCHGGLGRGTPKLGPDLSDSVWLNGDSSFAGIRAVITSGVATPRQYSVAMPAYAGMLSDSDLAHVAAYVYALSHPGALRRDSVIADTLHHADRVFPAVAPLPHDTMHPPRTP